MSDESKLRSPHLEGRVDEQELAKHVLSVRLGHGANCSSIGSVVDTLFASAVVTGAIMSAVCAALAREKVTTVGGRPQETTREPTPGGDDGQQGDGEAVKTPGNRG